MPTIVSQPRAPKRQRAVVAAIMERIPGRFSVELGLRGAGARPRELFLWFLASLLYGTRISGTIVRRTHHEFVRRGLVTPERVRAAGWDRLVEVLDAGGYVRYDYKTATKLLDVMSSLCARYRGDLNALHEAARDAQDLESRIKALGKGIGEVTVQIFLQELRGLWPKAEPALSPLAAVAARHLGLLEPRGPAPVDGGLGQLKHWWRRCAVGGYMFPDFESALVRLGRDYCRRQRYERCPMRPYCQPARVCRGSEPSGWRT